MKTMTTPPSSDAEDTPLKIMKRAIAAIEDSLSTPELVAAYNAEMEKKGYNKRSPHKPTVKREKRPKQSFVKMLTGSEKYFVHEDKNYVRYHFMNALRQMKYDIVIHEFPYIGCYADIMGIVAGRAIEFEIKSSRSDYEADFSKITLIGKRPVSKHGMIVAGETIVSKFFFIVPQGMLQISECAAHAGLITYTIEGSIPVFKVVKQAPMLNRDYLSPGSWQNICQRLQARNWNLVDRYVHTRFSESKIKIENAGNNTKY